MDEADIHDGIRFTVELSEAELEATRWASHGLTEQMTAEVMGHSLFGVKALLKQARRKLRAKNRAHLVATALRQGLID